MTLVNCSKCNGTKKTSGMGGIKASCTTCKGTGKVEKIAVVKRSQEDADKPVAKTEIVKPKRRKAVQLDMKTEVTDYE